MPKQFNTKVIHAQETLYSGRPARCGAPIRVCALRPISSFARIPIHGRGSISCLGMLDFARRTNEFVHINHRLTACANAGSAIRVCTSTTQKFNVILGQIVDSFARIPLNGGGSISCPGMLDCAEET